MEFSIFHEKINQDSGEIMGHEISNGFHDNALKFDVPW